MEKGKIIYYSDELNEEFSEAQITPKVIDENYKYIHKNVIWNASAFLLQNILSVPIKYLYAKLKFNLKYVGKEKLKPYKKQGYFIYGNHTQAFADTFITSNSNYPKKNFFIVNPENVSMPILGNTIQMLGAIPIPSNKEAMKNFLQCVEDKIKRGYSVTIFPEAHIWPYYTKIRPFKSVSFKYPIKLNVPSFSITNTYQSYGKNKDKVKIVTYIDGPFFPDEGLESSKAKQDNLRNKVYDKMVERSKNSNIEFVKYIKDEVG